jgi:hypothetical protein
MPAHPSADKSDQYPDEEIAARFRATLMGVLTTPPDHGGETRRESEKR